MDFKSSILRELYKFYRVVDDADFKTSKVTKGAFSKTRQLVDPYAFSRLSEVAVNTFFEEVHYYNWLLNRFLACDGNCLVLPNHPTIIEGFGQHSFGPKADSPRSLALCSLLYDSLNLVSLDAQIDKYTSRERDLLVKHLDKT